MPPQEMARSTFAFNMFVYKRPIAYKNLEIVQRQLFSHIYGKGYFKWKNIK